MRIPGGKVINVWYAPITEDYEVSADEPEFKSEF
jgi:hypothetical protein